MGIKYDPDNKFFNIDKETLDKEIRLISEELKNTGKSDDIVNKICLGKINKFKDDNSLLSQPWVMEPKKKVHVARIGVNLIVAKRLTFFKARFFEKFSSRFEEFSRSSFNTNSLYI